jgi:ATP-dependent helicase/nuclease subunit B
MDVEAALATAAARAFADYEANNPAGYPLVWQSIKEDLLRLLRQVVTKDLGELAASAFAPVSLETEVSTQLPADWPEPLKGLTIRGRMDRVDRKDQHVRVIDYKFKLGASPLPQDKNLLRAALRGERLQAPFYYLLAERWAEGKSAEPAPAVIEADFYYIAPRWPGGPLVSTPYGSEGFAGAAGAAIKQTIAYLADGVRQGRFFINRGEHCSRCDVAPICHKNHPPSLWRAEHDPITKPHRLLGEKDP